MDCLEQEWSLVTLQKRKNVTGMHETQKPLMTPVIHNLRPNIRLTLEHARLERRLRISDLAKACGCSESVLKRIESGEIVPIQSDVKNIEKVLDVRLFPDALNSL